MSAPASNSASPAPSGPSYLELYNQHDAPKPFKKVATYSTSSTGRKRNLKQILAAEQDAAFELGAAVAGREGKKRRRDHKKKSAQTDGANETGGSAFSGTSASGSKLIGAAAKAAQKRQERLKREAAAAAEADAATSREESVDDNADETGDVTMKTDVAADESLPPTEAPTGGVATPAAVSDEQAQAEQQERIRKMNLPTCELAVVTVLFRFDRADNGTCWCRFVRGSAPIFAPSKEILRRDRSSGKSRSRNHWGP